MPIKKTFKKGLLLLALSVLMPAVALAQNSAGKAAVSIKGVITSVEENAPVPFASIVVKGTMNGIQSDEKGQYALDNVPSNAVLVISSVGYKTVEVSVNGRGVVDVAINKDTQLLEETIVVAYGTAKKGSITGSAAVVSNEKLEKRITSNIGNALEGQVAGVITTSASGQPGESASIVIRGYGSINASKTPLYVIDGIPYDAGLNGINPNDIESITVLKDASSGALYGARGANGVVLITTKKGDAGAAKVSYTGTVGWANPALKYYDRVGQKDMVQLTYEALKSKYVSGGNDDATAAQLAKDNLASQLGGEKYNPFKNYTFATLIGDDGKVRSDAVSAWNEDWLDDGIIQHNAFRTEHNVTVSGGTEKVKGLLSVGYLNEDGYAKATGFQRISGRANVDAEIKSWLKSGLNVSVSGSKFNGIMGSGNSTDNYFYQSLLAGSIYPLYLKDDAGKDILDELGNKKLDWGDGRPTASNNSPLGILTEDKNYQTNMFESAKGYITLGSDSNDAGFLKGLKLTINAGINNRDRYQTKYNNMHTGPYADAHGRIYKYFSRRTSYTINQLLTWNRTFGNHTFDVLLGHEAYEHRFEYLDATKSNLFEGIMELRPATTNADCDSYSTDYTIESWLSRFNYSYADKYYFSASYRRDGSSRFKAENRWGNFWSVGGNWRISKESFMKDISWINNMNIKASYGVQGNDDLDTYYAWQSFYSLNWAMNNQQGALASTLENPAVTWEKNANFNVGFDAKLLNSRLDLSFEWYNRKTTDMLLNYPMAMSTGFSGYDANVGSMVNSGIEFTLGGVIMDRKNFLWRATLMGSTIYNKILSLTTENPSFTSGQQIYEVGKPMYTFYMPKFAGVNPETGNEQWYTYDEMDANGNVTNERITENYTEADTHRYYVGGRLPKINGSFGMEFSFFNCIDLSILTTYSLGGYVYDSVYRTLVAPQNYGAAISTDALNRWQKPGDVTDIPAFDIGTSYSRISSRFLINASYFSIKNITLGYTLPASVSKHIGASKIRIYGALDNFMMFSHLNGMDPQYNISGSTAITYAPTKTAVIGINLNF